MGLRVDLVHVTGSAEPHPRTFGQAPLNPSQPQARPSNHHNLRNHPSDHHNGIRVESGRYLVRHPLPACSEAPAIEPNIVNSYNRYIAVASRVVRRSLKEEKRIAAERRGESEIRFAKWDVRTPRYRGAFTEVDKRQNGKQGEIKNLAEANAAASESAASS